MILQPEVIAGMAEGLQKPLLAMPYSFLQRLINAVLKEMISIELKRKKLKNCIVFFLKSNLHTFLD